MVEVLKFYADWCKPCAMLSEILADKQVTNVDITVDKELTAQYKVRSVPTLVFLKDGVEMHRYSGLMYPKQFDEVVDRLSNTKSEDTKEQLTHDLSAKLNHNLIKESEDANTN